jgi:hypothetical protein
MYTYSFVIHDSDLFLVLADSSGIDCQRDLRDLEVLIMFVFKFGHRTQEVPRTLKHSAAFELLQFLAAIPTGR